MTYPRSHLVDPTGGVYHVCSRCVRRAFLCGTDRETGRDFNHRRVWIEARIHQLSRLFAVDLLGYAVMSNHYHIVLQLLPDVAMQWSDDEVVDRWLSLFSRQGPEAEFRAERERQALLQNTERLLVLRERLGSLSWFMRCLNEPIARLANREDQCKGRFWEGRFKSQRLLDEAAVLAAMVYVDLNPMRAGIATGVEDSHHTSIQYRDRSQAGDEELEAINSGNALPIECSLDEYKALLVWTALSQRKARPISQEARSMLKKLSTPHPEVWLNHYLPRPEHWQRAIGSLQSLKDYAKDLNQCWIKSRSMYLMY